jgi:hypothetical protein
VRRPFEERVVAGRRLESPPTGSLEAFKEDVSQAAVGSLRSDSAKQGSSAVADAAPASPAHAAGRRTQVAVEICADRVFVLVVLLALTLTYDVGDVVVSASKCAPQRSSPTLATNELSRRIGLVHQDLRRANKLPPRVGFRSRRLGAVGQLSLQLECDTGGT